MRVGWLELRDFRSYRSLHLQPVQGVNVLVGENAAGKTNVLEAIGFLAALRSFRSVPDPALIRDDQEAAVVRGEIERAEGSSLIEVELNRLGRRRVQVNRRRPARAADMLGHVRAVVFLPDDLDIVKRGPAYRREFLDRTAVQLWPGAYLDQQEYERALRQRNTLLRQEGRNADAATLAVWNERMSQAGAKVMERRARAVAALAAPIREAYRRLAGDVAEVEVSYMSEWGGSLETSRTQSERAGDLRSALEATQAVDRERRVTTVGPHRDEPVFILNGRDARTRASQGEQRTLTLSLRLAAHRAISDNVGESPVLLLDDVFSELDRERSAALAETLPAAQTFITTARREEVPVSGHRWTVAGGAVT